jgi:hypothetical protein
MYTGLVALRSIALVVALLVGVTPVIGAICQLDCDRPKAQSTKPACHSTSGASDGASMRDVAHPCGHRHDGLVAFVAGSSAREVGMSIAPLAVTSVPNLMTALQGACVFMTHSPPGLIARTATSLNTVLRI